MADLLDLRDWRIEISKERVLDPAEASADVSVVAGRKMAFVAFCDDFASQSSEDQRVVVIHELIHIHFEPMALLADDVAKKALSSDAADVFRLAFIQNLEYGVDGVALAIAPLFPLPPPLKRS
jgi:hypothetical protein